MSAIKRPRYRRTDVVTNTWTNGPVLNHVTQIRGQWSRSWQPIDVYRRQSSDSECDSQWAVL